MSEAWITAKKNAVTLFYLSIVSAMVKIVIGALRGEKRTGGKPCRWQCRNDPRIYRARIWTVATYFIIPAIVIEDRDLKGAVARASDIIQKHLLPIGVGEIAVGFVTGLLTIHWIHSWDSSWIFDIWRHEQCNGCYFGDIDRCSDNSSCYSAFHVCYDGILYLPVPMGKEC